MLAAWPGAAGMCCQISSAVNGRIGAINRANVPTNVCRAVWALRRATDRAGEV
jgi:hypothetical protein